MAILLWLLPAVVVTCAVMVWAAWVGRGRPALHERSDQSRARAQQRMAAALARPMPGRQDTRSAGGRSTGVAVRRD